MKTRTLLEYSTYMMQLIGSDRNSPVLSPSCSDKGSPSAGKKVQNQSAWINSLVGRIFWDFLREKYWADQVAHKIQKKLSKIKLPYFMNELTLADLDMGSCLPQVLTTSTPTLDRRGTACFMPVYIDCTYPEPSSQGAF
uniref:SMP-LTD domain-containing protein n=1 Tax=Xiphophorus couchianus TaxID=32473 RepID=A0A3B5LWA3_9TELE